MSLVTASELKLLAPEAEILPCELTSINQADPDAKPMTVLGCCELAITLSLTDDTEIDCSWSFLVVSKLAKYQLYLGQDFMCSHQEIMAVGSKLLPNPSYTRFLDFEFEGDPYDTPSLANFCWT